MSIYGEDLILDRLLHPSREGTYVDVGANHPHYGSNTYRLYVLGWKGLALDPNPAFAKLFRKHRPRDKHITVGVSAVPSTLTYYEFESDNLNTLSKQRADELLSEGRRSVRESQVPCEPLSIIVERELADVPIDLLNVDVEGMDMEVLQSLDLSRHRPSVMILEDYRKYTSFMNGTEMTPFERYVRDKGYLPIAQSAWSAIFVAEDWQRLFQRSRAFDEAKVQNSYMPGQFEALPWANSQSSA